MIKLTKINGDILVINLDQVESIESIPESKIRMMNGRCHVVSESVDEIIEKSLEIQRQARLIDIVGKEE